MKMKTLRKLRALAPRQVRRRAIEVGAGIAVDEGHDLAPEAIFDRMTGPYGGRHAGFDEET